MGDVDAETFESWSDAANDGNCVPPKSVGRCGQCRDTGQCAAGTFLRLCELEFRPRFFKYAFVVLFGKVTKKSLAGI